MSAAGQPDPRILAAADALKHAGRGTRGAIVARLAAELGISVQSAYRQLQALTSALRPRRRRRDAGTTSIAREDLTRISSMIEETRRQTGSGTLPLDDALRVGRANGIFQAASIDRGTGEVRAAHASTVRRALRQHYMHQAQLAVASPAARMASRHPNHVWQIDASISRQFYLAEDGTRPMPQSEFYRGKPRNFARISDRRLWRYVITDHASGCIELFYVLGAESASNLLTALIHAMTQRPGGTMHGIPRILMADPGSASNAIAVDNFCRTLGIQRITHAAGNPRATGQVEKSHHLVEIHFEAVLKLTDPVSCVEEINRHAQKWTYSYNATEVHTRTGMKRRDGWLRITPQELLLAPPIEVLRQLPNSKPIPCKVRDCMIRLRNEYYDVRGVPGLINGATVEALVNALDPVGSVRVLMPGEVHGEPLHYIAPRIPRNEYGFLDTAAVIGETFRSPPETPADAARKELDRVAMEVATDAEVRAARKAKKLPFGGRIDPLKHLTDAPPAPHLPRAGTQSDVQAPATVMAARRIEPQLQGATAREFAPYSHFEAANALRPRLAARGIAWTAAMMQATQAQFPDGVPYDALDAWCEQLYQGNRLRAVGGGQ